MSPRNASAPDPIPDEPSEQVRLEMALEQMKKELEYAEAARDQALAQEEVARATLKSAALGKYFFQLTSNLRPVSNRETVGFDVPEGIRLHVDYLPDEDEEKHEVTTDPDAPLLATNADGWGGITGKILTGGDWVLIQKSGVARFDARVTIKTDDGVLIDAVFSGDVDLAAAVPSFRGKAKAKDLGAAVYDAYLNGKPEVTSLPVALSVRFEAADQPYLRPGEDDAWIEKSRYAKQRRNFPKYQRLVRGLFVARGTVTLALERRWPPTAIALQISELV